MKTTYVYPRDAEELKQLVGRRFRVTAVAHESNWGKPGYIESVLQHEGALENVSRKSMAFDGYVFASWGDVTIELLDEPESEPRHYASPDRFTVCPDDCVTKEEMREMMREIQVFILNLDFLDTHTKGRIRCMLDTKNNPFDLITHKYLGEQQ